MTDILNFSETKILISSIMSNNSVSGVVNAASGNSAAAAEGGGGGGGGGENFPAALPYAHWRALGIMRQIALDMVLFQEFLSAGTTYTRTITAQPTYNDSLVNNGFVEDGYGIISLKFRPKNAPARTVYIRHYEELHSQWEHVANSLTACPLAYFRDVVIDKIELSQTVMDMLGAALATKQIDVLTLSYNNLDYVSLTTSYLENTPNIRDLVLVGNPLQDVSTALQFASAISTNEHMEKLEMRECGLGENDVLQTMLPYLSLLHSLNIGYNDITSKDAPFIASFIASNPTAKLLNVSCNEFNDSDATKFANALKKNLNIQRMQMNGTDITEKGRAKVNAVAEKKTLPKLLVSMNDAGRKPWATVPDAPKLLTYEHWRSLGYDRESSKVMVVFQNNLHGLINGTKQTCEFLHHNGDVDVDAYRVLSQHPFIAHHSSLLPKWKGALKGFQKNSSRDVNKVRVKRVQLVSDVMDVLGNAISAKRVVHLTLANNRLDRQGYISLSKFLEKKPPLKILELEGNPFEDVACAQRFSEAVIAHSSLEKLKVEDCELGGNTQILSAIASTMNRVSYLSLSSNDIGNNGAAVIGNILSTDPAPLTTLHVSFNEIDDDGVTSFAEALRTNTNLKDLHLGQNVITALGESLLKKAVYNDTSLITLFNSNHTCKIHASHNLCPETNKKLKTTIKNKMTSAMFGSYKVTDTRTIPMNMHLFADAPVELMPVELSFINRCSKFENKPCLSNMFEVVRTWNVQVMFGYSAGAVAPVEKKRRRKNGTNTIAKKAKS